MTRIARKILFPVAWRLGLALVGLLLVGCQWVVAELPTRAQLAAISPTSSSDLPATWTPLPATALPTATPAAPTVGRPPSTTPLPIPTNTPITPSPTPSVTPFPSATGTATPVIKPLNQYALDEVIPPEAFPRPPGDNGWGMHWIPTNSQSPAVVDRFVSQLVRMHIEWVVFLNDGANIGDNDYLVERLVASGIMPVMRVYRSNIQPYDSDLGPMVAYYRRKGVYYYQLYNEPNANEENSQGFANTNQYANAWAAAARQVVANGGLPGIGALSPGGAYNHYTFLDRTLRALHYNGDAWLLNRTWLSVHNYHGTRPFDDPDGFLLFRRYDEIIRTQLGHSMAMIGTEGGSYSPDPQVEKELIIYQYTYMRQAEPYFLAFSYWLLANQEGGAWDTRWEWQALFRNSFVHPAVTDFFYKTLR
ncbi:MAG: hypothetical protein L0332_27160 [Chloroflexi bacterium]|nr:hypothetical protein [Chloroflexota bacterium]MCI0577140.1 hypothetical protein [Chloroflexota bacterium]MCI0644680.1 hypothetical protein [Chloroflexota bacterium]MCI0730378.1 hypothetical protein [Chloroflexota bacterium]